MSDASIPDTAPLTVACPTCGGSSLFASSNPSRPFCSQRCKNIDLGAWAAEEFRVPEPSNPADNALGDPRHEP